MWTISRSIVKSSVSLVALSVVWGLLGCGETFIDAVDQGDRFEVLGGHITADILWLVDTSGTMSEEQAALTASAPAFLDALLEADLDFHLGVVSLDLHDEDSAGVLLGTPAYLTRETPDLEALFLARAIPGTSGGKNEQGLDAALLALTGAPAQAENIGFRRSSADALLFFISDEDDASEVSVGSFVERLEALTGAQRLRVHGLVGDAPLGCAASNAAAEAGTRYLEAIQAVEGLSWSICQAPYSDFFRAMVRELVRLPDTFHLSGMPDPDTLEVTLDEIILRERPQDGWTYLPDQNAIQLRGTALPTSGQVVTVKYRPYRVR